MVLILQKTITAVRSTNFLSRLLSGVKATVAAEDAQKPAQGGLTTKATSTTPTTPPSPSSSEDKSIPPSGKLLLGWRKAAVIEEEHQHQGKIHTGK